MRNARWSVRLAGFSLGLLMLGGVALAAGQQGSESDPLVTLSYLNGPATEQVMGKVEDKLSTEQAKLKKDLEAVVARYEDEVRKAAGSGTGTALSANYAVVSLPAGESIIGLEGCEFLVRGGSVVCVSELAPGLIDMTDGTTLLNGGTLATNHLYLGSIDGRGVKAVSNATVLVRGSYEIK